MTHILHVRRATCEDCQLYWEWANEEAVRVASFSNGPIPWDTHSAWFENHVNAADCRLYVVCEPSGRPVAQVRFEIEGKNAVVSVSVGAQHRQKGYGLLALLLATERLFNETDVGTLDAFIRPDNKASVGLFRKAGYGDAGPAMLKGQAALHLTFARDAHI